MSTEPRKCPQCGYLFPRNPLEEAIHAHGYTRAQGNEFVWFHPNGRNWLDTRWPDAQVREFLENQLADEAART